MWTKSAPLDQIRKKSGWSRSRSIFFKKSEIYRRFFADFLKKKSTPTSGSPSLEISSKYHEFMIFRPYFGDFFDFPPIFGPTDYRLAISFRGRSITDISVIFWPKKPKFCSLFIIPSTFYITVALSHFSIQIIVFMLHGSHNHFNHFISSCFLPAYSKKWIRV